MTSKTEITAIPHSGAKLLPGKTAQCDNKPCDHYTVARFEALLNTHGKKAQAAGGVGENSEKRGDKEGLATANDFTEEGHCSLSKHEDVSASSVIRNTPYGDLVAAGVSQGNRKNQALFCEAGELVRYPEQKTQQFTVSIASLDDAKPTVSSPHQEDNHASFAVSSVYTGDLFQREVLHKPAFPNFSGIDKTAASLCRSAVDIELLSTPITTENPMQSTGFQSSIFQPSIFQSIRDEGEKVLSRRHGSTVTEELTVSIAKHMLAAPITHVHKSTSENQLFVQGVTVDQQYDDVVLAERIPIGDKQGAVTQLDARVHMSKLNVRIADDKADPLSETAIIPSPKGFVSEPRKPLIETPKNMSSQQHSLPSQPTSLNQGQGQHLIVDNTDTPSFEARDFRLSTKLTARIENSDSVRAPSLIPRDETTSVIENTVETNTINTVGELILQSLDRVQAATISSSEIAAQLDQLKQTYHLVHNITTQFDSKLLKVSIDLNNPTSPLKDTCITVINDNGKIRVDIVTMDVASHQLVEANVGKLYASLSEHPNVVVNNELASMDEFRDEQRSRDQQREDNHDESRKHLWDDEEDDS